ncbi:monooxygenase [Mycobacterium malmoense]|uniref:Monooxygenase n=2 Tax=Mycobacterium malmoense TaxID=1780 RepID=A0ABX3SW85_MYCMA|nr:monooxygenase [Mycobacterium malmoense]
MTFMTSPLRVGIMLPSRETAMTGQHDARGLIKFATDAEDGGFDSVWVGDSLLARTRVEPLSILSAVAAVTSRVTLGTAALIAPLRHPLLAAAQVASVDQISGGRLVVGLGSGSPLPESRREFDAVDVPFAARGARLDETVALWRQAWDEQGRFAGRFWRIEDLAGALPTVKPKGPPLWLAGGDSAKVIERVANTYDGWLPYLPDADAYRRAWEQIAQRAVRPITPALYATVNLNGDHARAREELDTYTRLYYRQPIDVMSNLQAFRSGSVEECLDWLGRYVEAGARHLILRIGSLDAHPETLAERLVPALRTLDASV